MSRWFISADASATVLDGTDTTEKPVRLPKASVVDVLRDRGLVAEVAIGGGLTARVDWARLEPFSAPAEPSRLRSGSPHRPGRQDQRPGHEPECRVRRSEGLVLDASRVASVSLRAWPEAEQRKGYGETMHSEPVSRPGPDLIPAVRLTYPRGQGVNNEIYWAI